MFKKGQLVQKIHFTGPLIHSIGRIKSISDESILVASLLKQIEDTTWPAGSFKSMTDEDYMLLRQRTKKRKKNKQFINGFAKAVQSSSKKRRRLHSPISITSPRYHPPIRRKHLSPRPMFSIPDSNTTHDIQKQKDIIKTYRGKNQPPLNKSTLSKHKTGPDDILLTHPQLPDQPILPNRICMIKAHSSLENRPRFMSIPHGVQLITLTQLCDDFPLQEEVDQELVTFMVENKKRLFESENPYKLTTDGSYLQTKLQKVDASITIRNHVFQDVVVNHRVSFVGLGCASEFGCGVQEYDLDAPPDRTLIVNNKMDTSDILVSDIIEQFGKGIYVCVFCRSCVGVNAKHLKLYRQLSGM